MLFHFLSSAPWYIWKYILQTDHKVLMVKTDTQNVTNQMDKTWQKSQIFSLLGSQW